MSSCVSKAHESIWKDRTCAFISFYCCLQARHTPAIRPYKQPTHSPCMGRRATAPTLSTLTSDNRAGRCARWARSPSSLMRRTVLSSRFSIAACVIAVTRTRVADPGRRRRNRSKAEAETSRCARVVLTEVRTCAAASFVLDCVFRDTTCGVHGVTPSGLPIRKDRDIMK